MSILFKLTSTLGGIACRLAPQPTAHLNGFRFNASHVSCIPLQPPRCSPGQLAMKCPIINITSPWLNKDCCAPPCPDTLPRFDDLYYKPSDKLCRRYAQTWVECPELVIKPKPICCYDPTCLPPIERRPRKIRTVREYPRLCNPMPCGKLPSTCLRIRMPGCPVRGARVPPTCKKGRPKLDCKKYCTPYPSYSECCRCLPKPLHPIECRCLEVGPSCGWGKTANEMKEVTN